MIVGPSSRRHLPRVVIVAAIAATAGGCASSGETTSAAPPDSTVEITARSFRFDPHEIHLGAGDLVTIRLTSRGAHHDLVIEEARFEIAADQGDSTEATLSAPPTGRYRFYCSVPGHRNAGMEGTLVVEP